MREKRKRTGREKELGGAEKKTIKKRKLLQQDAAKCAKLTEIFKKSVKDDAGPSTSSTGGQTGLHGGGLLTGNLKRMLKMAVGTGQQWLNK